MIFIKNTFIELMKIIIVLTFFLSMVSCLWVSSEKHGYSAEAGKKVAEAIRK